MGTIDRYLINRDYARLWYGQAVSLVGDAVFDTTLVLWVSTKLAKGQTWAPAAVSGIMISIFAAVMVVGPLAGVFVDRWHRRHTMLRTEVIRALLVGGLTVLAFLPVDTLPTWAWLGLIYLVVFAVNAAEQFFNSSRFATIGQIVHGEVDRTRAAGIGQATQATAAIIGPPIAAPLLFTVGLQWALLANALSYVVSYVAINSIRTPLPAAPEAAERQSVRKEFVAGLHMFAGNRFLVTLLTTAVIAQLATGGLSALEVFFVTDNLHAHAGLLGFVTTAFGVGAVIGALAAGHIVKALNARRTTWIAFLLGGVLVVLYSRQTVFGAGLAMFFLVAIPVTVLNTSITPLLLAATPNQYLGRISSVFNPINQTASLVSVAVSGWLASTVMLHFHAHVLGVSIGRIDTIFSVGGLLIAGAGIYAAFAFPREMPAGDGPPEAPETTGAAPAEPVVVEEALVHDASVADMRSEGVGPA